MAEEPEAPPVTIESLLLNYIAAGFSPADFWGLTIRLYDLHMRGAMQRLKRESESRNRQAYNTAALSGGAFAGELPDFDQVFGHDAEESEQSEDQIVANAKAWAAQFGVLQPG